MKDQHLISANRLDDGMLAWLNEVPPRTLLDRLTQNRQT